jgi:hypothetical protein
MYICIYIYILKFCFCKNNKRIIIIYMYIYILGPTVINTLSKALMNNVLGISDRRHSK